MTVEVAKDEQGYLKINLGDGWRYITWIDFHDDNTIELDVSLTRPIKLQRENETYKQFVEVMGLKGGAE